jgi:hypothetical protein
MTTLPYSNDTTSYQAAQSATPSKVKVDRKLIAEYIAKMASNGATDDDLARALPSVHPNALRARRGELWAHGVISDAAGETRATATGARAKVWHITDRGIALLKWPADSWCIKTGVA